MPISYTKTRPASPSRPTSPTAAGGMSKARSDLRYALQQYDRLTAVLDAARVANTDQMRKGTINTRELYTQRAAAAAQMARAAHQVLGEV